MADVGAQPLILASASPFRRRMLEAAGLSFRAVAADLDEGTLKREMLQANAMPPAIAEALARAKAEAVGIRFSEGLVIGCDQVLALGGELFSKPAGRTEARVQLQQLRGKSHRLHSAVVLATGGKIVWSHVDIATLVMRAFSDDFLIRYLDEAGDRVCHTVGAYEIEGLGIQLFDRIEGDYFGIIGLPLLPLLAELRARRAVPT